MRIWLDADDGDIPEAFTEQQYPGQGSVELQGAEGKVLADREMLRGALEFPSGVDEDAFLGGCRWPGCEFAPVPLSDGPWRPHSGTCPLREAPDAS